MGLVLVIGGLLCHLFFHHFESEHPLAHLTSLVIPPIILCLVSIPYPSINIFLKALTIYMGTVLLSVVVYRLSPFHPLAMYPGPVLAKVTKLWPAWIATSGKQHIWNRELHRKYGEVVRIGPNELSIIDPEAINPLLGSKELPKGPSWKGRQASMKSNSLIGVQDVEEHARRRRPWRRGLSTTALKDYEGVLMKRVRQLANSLAQQTAPVDLSLWIGYFTYDFMSDMGFGGGPEMMRNGDKDGLLKILDGGLLPGLILGHLPWIAPYYALLPPGNGLNKFRQFAGQQALARRTAGPTSKDLFYYLNNDDGHEPTYPTINEVAAEGSLVIVAGSDTTSTTLSNIFYFLTSNPKAYGRLNDEINAFFPSGEDCLNPAIHAKMPYLNAVINESLRLYPAVPSGSHRINASLTETQLIGKYEIPPRTSVIIPHYALHRDPARFSPFPDAFIPERWLPIEMQIKFEPKIYGLGQKPKGDPNPIRHDTRAFIPFSHGPSNCVGKALAIQEMRMVMCLLLKTFHMNLSPKHERENAAWTDKLEDCFILRRGRLMIDLLLHAEI